MEFNLYTPGTRVIYTGDTKQYAPIVKGEKGTIVAVVERAYNCKPEYAYDLGVDWDKASFRKHDCSGAARQDHGWWVVNGDVTFEPKKEIKKKGGKTHDIPGIRAVPGRYARAIC